MTDQILSQKELEFFISSWQLIQGRGGVFEVKIDGESVFSKKAIGRHAEPGEVEAIIRERIEAIRPPGFHMPED